MGIAELLVVIAFVLFVLAAIGIAAGRINLIAAGLACYMLSMLVGVF